MSDQLRYWLFVSLVVAGTLALAVAVTLIYNVWLGLIPVFLGFGMIWEDRRANGSGLPAVRPDRKDVDGPSDE